MTIQRTFKYVIAILLFLSGVAEAQTDWECGTIGPAEDYLLARGITEYSPILDRVTLRIFIHVINRTNGTGGLSQPEVDNAIAIMRSDFAPREIYFYELGRGAINNDYYFNFTPERFDQLIQVNSHTNAIDVYLLPMSVNYGGRAADIPSTAFVVDGSLSQTSVISHEMGHCLGLWHTHSGRGCGDFRNCAEAINGSNCATCGDLVCDTPADPCLAGIVNALCQYTGPPEFSPDVSNIMSYTRPGCMTHFTTGQFNRSLTMIENSPILQAVVIPDEVVWLHQRLQGSTSSVDSIARWEAGSQFVTYAAPKRFSFSVGTHEVLRGAQKIISSQKYNKWSIDDTVLNHRKFAIEEGFPDELVSQFAPTDPTITIKTDLIDLPGTTGGNIQFRDPWYIDSIDAAHGNTPMNRGMHNAVFRNRESTPPDGFKPNFDTPFPPLNHPYRGVFLEQGNPPSWNEPHYSIAAPSQQIGNFTWNLVNWTTVQGSAQFQNPYAAQTGVVFQSENTTVAARMKAHMASTSPTATGPNNQRKLWWWPSWGEHSLTYASGGMLWQTSSDGSGQWANEVLVSTPADGERDLDPSDFVAIPGIPGPEPLFFTVWHRSGSGSDVIKVREDHSQWEHTIAGFTPHATIPAAPVVALKRSLVGVHDPEPLQHTVVAWSHSGGIDTAVATYQGVGIGEWASGRLSEARFRPSFAVSQNCVFSSHLYNTLFISYDDNRGVYWRKRLTTGVSACPPVPGEKDPETRRRFRDSLTAETFIPSSRTVYTHFSRRSQIAIDLSDPLVVWEMHEGTSIEGTEPKEEERGGELLEQAAIPSSCPWWKSIAFARPQRGPQFAAKWVGCDYQSPTVAVAQGGRVAVAWSDRDRIIVVRSTDEGESWTRPEALHEGMHPMFSVSAGNLSAQALYAYTEGMTVPYRIGFEEGIVRENTSEDFLSARSIELSTTDHEAALAIDIPQLWIKTTGGSIVPIAFSRTMDSTVTPAAVASYLRTQLFTIGEDADSIFVGIRMASRNASALANQSGKVRARFRFTPPQGTMRYTAGIWRFTGDHYFNRTLRIPAQQLRGRTMQFEVSLLGINYEQTALRASASEAHYLLPAAQHGVQPKSPVASSELPTHFALEQNYPNPFNPLTVIRYSVPSGRDLVGGADGQLPVESHVSLKVYDLLGREVATLVNETKGAGYYETTFDASHLGSGVYFYRMQAVPVNGGESFTQVRKFVVMK